MEALEQDGSGNESILLTSSMLDQSVSAILGGEVSEEAFNMALDAYLTGFEKVEPDLFVKRQGAHNDTRE